MLFNEISVSQNAISKTVDVSKTRFYKKLVDENVQPVDIAAPRKRYGARSCRQIYSYYLKKYPVKDKINIFYNFKGGTGKTTVCFQIASMLALFGYNVLTVDLDPQAHLTNILRFNEGDKINTAYDFIINGLDIDKCIYPVFEGLDAIPSSIELTRIEIPLSQKTRREETLSKLLNSVKDRYDFILIDTNPALSTLNVNALFAADRVNIVCETQPFSLSGLCILIEELEKMFYELQKPLNFGVIANKFEAKTATAQEVLGVLRADYSKEMMNTVVRKCEELNLASKTKMPILSFASIKSAAFEDVFDLVNEFISLTSEKIKEIK